MQKLLYFLLSITFISCAKKQCPDILSYEDYSKKEIELPYVLDIKNGNKHLVYYGVKHSFDPNDPMFTDIEKRFNDLKPDIVFNEGGDGWPEIDDRDSTIILTGDPGFTRFLSRKNNTEIKSIEPPDSLEYNHLLTKFKQEDIVLMYFCRQVEQLQHQQGVTDSLFTRYIENFLQELRNNGMPMNEDEVKMEYIKSYYKAFFKTELNWKAFDATNYQPIYSKTILNEIMRESTYFRDRHIIRQLEEALKKKDKVFIVMGGSHLVIEEPALRCMMENMQ